MGTELYWAPEVKTGQYNINVDVFSLAVILYQMIEGKLPNFGVDGSV